jgi:hypothetical protein
MAPKPQVVHRRGKEDGLRMYDEERGGEERRRGMVAWWHSGGVEEREV